jgi:hypothetical protein
VAGEGVEIGTQRLDVERAVRGPLRAIDDEDGAHGVGGGTQALEVGHRTRDVRDVGRGDDAGAAGDEAVEPVEVEAAFVGDG